MTGEETFHSFLVEHDQRYWNQLLSRIVPSLHPVDQAATQIWFSFWPLKLSRALHQSDDPVQTAKDLELDGSYRLEDQLDSSVEFLYGCRYWPQVKKAVLAHARSCTDPAGMNLQMHILKTADTLAAVENVVQSLLLGITATGFMVFQQVGVTVFSGAADKPGNKPDNNLTADQVVQARAKKTRGSLFGFLHGTGRKFTVIFDEKRAEHTFQVIRGQDLSMASAADERDYTTEDPRRIAGPIPAQCRSAACGYCWIGVLDGREKLCEITEFERKRLKYFGYTSQDSDHETHPIIRLSCQSKCYGDVSVVVPPWNGALKGRH